MTAMAESATERVTIAAPIDVVYRVALDIERYPEWVRDIEEATIVDRDAEGRPLLADFGAAAMGFSTHYRLAYDHDGAPHRLAWRLDKGDIMRAVDGAYTFSVNDADPAATDVVYDLAIELVVPLPGFVRRRAEVRILNTLKELKTRAESIG
jgi:uncharacterized membrane protein